MGKQPGPPPLPRSLIFARARWKHAMRYVGAFILILLNFSLVMSTIQLHQGHHALDPVRELASFMVVFFFDLTILLPIVLEVDAVEITPDQIVFATLLGKRKCRFEEISYFANPVYLNYVIVKAGSGLYLLNKRDISEIQDLVQIIDSRRTKLPQ